MTHRSPLLPEPETVTSLYRDEITLATKYLRQGPRYTSYPTALQFRPDFPREEQLEHQRRNREYTQEPLSLYVHLPFCRDECYSCACNRLHRHDKNAARKYLQYLKREISMQAKLVGGSRPITQMHWGGGTPAYLDHAEMTELMYMLASHFHLINRGQPEYTIEIDPRIAQPDTIALLKGLGFNRISLDIQDFDPLVQKTIHRAQQFNEIKTLVECIRRYDFRSLSFDLIHGLPHQDRHSIEETLRKVVSLQPDRIAWYSYAHLPGRFSGQHAINTLDLPRSREKLLLHQIISHRLQEAGYLHIGLDYYVLPQDPLAIAQEEGRLQRSLQGYSLHLADDILGLGVSATSQIGDFYAQNALDLESYYAALKRGETPIVRGCKVSREDKLRRHIIMSLICELRLDSSECGRRFGLDFALVFEKELRALRSMETDGLLHLNEDHIRITARGRAFLSNICMLFDAYLEPAHNALPGRKFPETNLESNPA
jgi:oxygen-independent coproporphyrinogen III oxidase